MSSGALLARRILGNDLRLFWRGNASKKAAWATTTLGRIVILGILHLFMYGMFAAYGSGVRGGPELVCITTLALLGMTALQRSLEVLYNRGDLALLLTSPVPPRVVLLTRLVDITVTSLLGTLTIVLPITNVAIAMFGWQWAWGYLAWLCTTLAIVPAAVLATVVTVERIGARRARTVLQAFGILIGMLGFVATQLPQWLQSGGTREARRALGEAARTELYAWFDVSPLRQIAAAASGSWQWLLPLVGIGAGLFVLAQYTLAKRFTHGAQSAAGDVGGAPDKSIAPDAAWRHAFVRSRWRVLLRTQLLLLRRDPLLWMRCAMQIISLVPMLFGALMVQRAAGIGGVGLMAAAIVPLQLAALRNANDEANEFEASSPLRPRDRAGIRCAAAAAPLLVFVWAIAIGVAALAGPVPALMVAVAGSVNAFASAWLGTCTTRVHTAEERSRNRAPRAVWQMFVGMLIAGLGTSGVGAVAGGYSLVGWSLFAGALAVAGAQFLFKPQAAAPAS